MKSRSRPGQAASTDAQAKVTTESPKAEHIIEAVRWLLEGLPVPDKYLDAIASLIERARQRGRRREAA